MEDLTNIWNAEDELNEDQVMNYVKGNSSLDEQYTVEENMNDSSFLNDAVEGLQQLSSTEKIDTYVQQINKQLHKRLRYKKFKRKTITGNLSWEIIAVIIVILLCLIGYAVIKMR